MQEFVVDDDEGDTTAPIETELTEPLDNVLAIRIHPTGDNGDIDLRVELLGCGKYK